MAVGKKRKSDSKSTGSTPKKPMKAHPTAPASTLPTLEAISASIVQDPSLYNPLARHISALRTTKSHTELRNVLTILTKIFLQLLAASRIYLPSANGSLGDSNGSGNAPTASELVAIWLKGQMDILGSNLVGRIGSKHGKTAVLAWRLALKLFKGEAAAMIASGGAYQRSHEFIVGATGDLVYQVLKCDASEEVCAAIVEDCQVYADLRMGLYDGVRAAVFGDPDEDVDQGEREREIDESIELMGSLSVLPAPKKGYPEKQLFLFFPPAALDASQTEANSKKRTSRTVQPLNYAKLQSRASATWLALFSPSDQPLTISQRKGLLEAMRPTILPTISSPELLLDFLTDCVDMKHDSSPVANLITADDRDDADDDEAAIPSTRTIPLLALEGLFHLIQHHNLDYPQFYTRLYALLTPSLLHLPNHLPKFLRLLDIFLRSSHLPAALVASFIKRLSRLSLTAPPGGIIPLFPLVYNLIQRHRSCAFLLHRIHDPRVHGPYQDPFAEMQPDPSLTHAENSSIWELHQMEYHWNPQVSSLAKILSQPFTKPEYQLEDFLGHGYAGLLATEMGRGNLEKRGCEVEYFIPKTIFGPNPAGETEAVEGRVNGEQGGKRRWECSDEWSISDLWKFK